MWRVARSRCQPEMGDIRSSSMGRSTTTRRCAKNCRGPASVSVRHCDTEVLPYLFARHGVDMVSKLDGMFAFAIWDRAEKRLFAARDRFGIKPFLYSHDRDRFVFASELRSLLRHPHISREKDTDALSMYFTLNYIPEPSTAFVAAKKLPAGHWLLVQDGKLEVRRYWDLERIVPEPVECSEREALHELDNRLRQAIRSQMVSDVPLGAFLSGGIDSGLVVSYMAELSQERVKTFSIGFDQEPRSELPLARIVAERYRTDHHELVVRPNAVDLLSRMVENFGEPFGDSSCIPTYLVSQLARGDVTVCLSGDGGDEVFAGYTQYVKVAAIDKLKVLPRPLLTAARSMTRQVDRPAYRSAQRMLKRAALPFAESYLEGVCFLDEAWAGSSSDVAKHLTTRQDVGARHVSRCVSWRKRRSRRSIHRHQDFAGQRHADESRSRIDGGLARSEGAARWTTISSPGRMHCQFTSSNVAG